MIALQYALRGFAGRKAFAKLTKALSVSFCVTFFTALLQLQCELKGERILPIFFKLLFQEHLKRLTHGTCSMNIL